MIVVTDDGDYRLLLEVVVVMVVTIVRWLVLMVTDCSNWQQWWL